ncbi:Laminin-like protein epi-1 [Picochlorum sp. SENEW3]|nr:Laminin-like protein epi-1 [Picochlorum sp. SENEW3]WPT15744.1 Laminin-like protein epi-1 [Picochlorum sp. SENEW3]
MTGDEPQQQGAGSAGGQEEQQASLLGKIFGGAKKKVTKAKMGLDMEMYYNEELKCWVMPGEEEEKRQQMMGGGNGPPPMISSLQQQPQGIISASEDAMKGHDMVTRQRMTRSTSRYAVMPTLRIGQPGNADGSSEGSSGIMAGLKPPPLSGTGGNVQAFRPMSVFKPTAMNGNSEESVEEPVADNDLMMGRKDTEEEDSSRMQQDTKSIDPIVLEILSFWSYYRSSGYGIDVMKEWVSENYDEDFCLQLDFEQMLAEERISRAVDEYIESHRQDDNSKENAVTIEYNDAKIENTWKPHLPGSDLAGDSQPTTTTKDIVAKESVVARVMLDDSEESRHDEDATALLQPEWQDEAADPYCHQQSEAVQHAYETYSVTRYNNVEQTEEEPPVDIEEDMNIPGQCYDNDVMQEESQAMVDSFDKLNEFREQEEHDHLDSKEIDRFEEAYENSRMKHIPSAAMDNAEIGGRLDVGESDPVALPMPTAMAGAEKVEADTTEIFETLNKKLEQARSTIEDKENRINELQNLLDSMMEEKTTEKAQLEQDLENAHTEIDTLQAELRGQIAASNETEDALAHSNERITLLEMEAQDLKSQVQDLEGQCEDLADSARLLRESEQDITALKQNAESLSGKNATLTAQVTELLEQIEQLQEERDVVESKRLEAVAAQKKVEDEFQATLDERDAEIMQLEARVTLSEKAAQGAYEKAKDELRSEMSDLEELVEDKEAKLKELDEKVSEQERKLLKAKKKIQAQNTQIDELTADCKSLEQQLDDGKHERETLMMEKSAMEQQIRLLEQDLKNSEQSYIQEIEDLRRERQIMTDKLCHKESDLEEMAEELSRLRFVEDQLTHWEHAASAAQDALLEEKADRDFAQAQVAELEQQLAKVSQELIEATSRIEDVEQLKHNLAEQFEGMQHTLQSQCDDYSTRLRVANATIEKSQQEIEDLTALLHKYETQGSSTEDLETEMASLRHQLASLSGGVSQKDEEVRKYKLQLVKAKKLRASDQERIDELEEMNREYEAKLQESAGRLQIADDDSLDEALVALGQEEAKVSRLVELLRMAGLTDGEIDAELASVELEVGFGGEADDDLL